MQLMKPLPPLFKENYLRLIANGYVEVQAIKELNVEWISLFELISIDEEFRSNIDIARKKRADRWVDDIALSLQHEYINEETNLPRAPNKDETARDKLHFEKRKFLAQVDNPEKYSLTGKTPKVDIDINMSDFKLLTPQESIKVLTNDPFNTIDAVSTTITKEE